LTISCTIKRAGHVENRKPKVVEKRRASDHCAVRVGYIVVVVDEEVFGAYVLSVKTVEMSVKLGMYV
jgi:hypothetical protein